MTAPTASRIWPGDEPGAPPHPAPEVPCRLATDDEVPRGARTVRRHAQAHGWTVVATYARGTRRGRVPRVVDSLALRMWGEGNACRAVGVWLDGRFNNAMVWRVGQCPRLVKAATLRAWLAGER